MKKDLEIQIPIFTKHIQMELGGRLFPKIISTLSNMIAIDFINRLHGSNELVVEHAENCCRNITEYLNNTKQEFSDTFASSSILFSIAISPPPDGKKITSLKQIDNQEEVIEASIGYMLPKIEDAEQDSLKDVMKIILGSEEVDSVINFISNDTKLTASINAKYTKKMNDLRTQTIAAELYTAHAMQHSLLNLNQNTKGIDDLVKDLSSHISTKDANPRDLDLMKNKQGKLLGFE